MTSKPTLPTTSSQASVPQDSKPRRTTKVAHKLKVLPEQPETPPAPAGVSDEDKEEASGSGNDELEPEDEDEVPVYKQISQIPAGTARRDALRLTKKQKAKLPRVTAYCTANSYKMPELMKFFMARKEAYSTAPKQFDEVIYTPYSYEGSPSPTISRRRLGAFGKGRESLKKGPREGDLLGIPELREPEDGDEVDEQPAPTTATINGNSHQQHDLLGGEDNDHDSDVTPLAAAILKRQGKTRFDPQSDHDSPSTPEVFLFEYGTVVIWGMSEAQEKRFLSSIRRFEIEKLPLDDVESEDLNYYYANYSRFVRQNNCSNMSSYGTQDL
ncbi:hypothetical protein FRB99_003795 [Tulasnella sp. 403]|nr:hypothetical protein FRB99_003795 [Tulasnella sp. 403]